MPDPYQQVIDRLRPCKKVLITTHARPDGDALGSTAAMSLALRKINIASEILLLSHLRRQYSFLSHDHGLSLAIVAHAGCFHLRCTPAQTLRLAATLMELGVHTDRIYEMLYQTERAERVALQTRAQDSLELLADGGLAVMPIRKEDFQQ